MNKNILVVMLCITSVFLFDQSNASAQEGWVEDLDACSLPSSVVKITVRQDGERPVYEFTITNLYKEPLYVISIGRGYNSWIRFSDELVPIEFISPDGWEGIRGGVESPYIFYFWGVEMKEKDYRKYEIKPNMTLSGFKLVMKEPLVIIKILPFDALFSDGKCAYGTVVEEK